MEIPISNALAIGKQPVALCREGKNMDAIATIVCFEAKGNAPMPALRRDRRGPPHKPRTETAET